MHQGWVGTFLVQQRGREQQGLVPRARHDRGHGRPVVRFGVGTVHPDHGGGPQQPALGVVLLRQPCSFANYEPPAKPPRRRYSENDERPHARKGRRSEGGRRTTEKAGTLAHAAGKRSPACCCQARSHNKRRDRFLCDAEFSRCLGAVTRSMGESQTPRQRPAASATIGIAAASAIAAAIPTAAPISAPRPGDDASAAPKTCHRKATTHL
jgi:hypothetical protein